jgi:hypothetical protein
LLSDFSSAAVFGIDSDAFTECGIVEVHSFEEGLVGSRMEGDGVAEMWVEGMLFVNDGRDAVMEAVAWC